MSFDADAFLNTTVTGPMSTAPVLCPEGEYKMMIDDGDKALSFRSGEKNGNTWAQCSVLCSVLDDNVKAALKRDKVLVPFNCFLDMNDAGDQLDLSEGKNVNLGRLRKAVNQNDSGPWAPAMLKGRGPFMGKVSHRVNKETNEKFAEVTRVASIV